MPPTAVGSIAGDYRPSGAVYLLREGSHSGFRRPVQEASTRRNSITEPIVPVSPDGHGEHSAQRLVKIAHVDGAVNVDLPKIEVATAAANLSLPWVPLAQIDTTGPVTWTCRPA